MLEPVTFHTGDLPIDALIDEQNSLHALRHVDSCAAWSGCLDAPGYVPGGSTICVRIAPNTFDHTSRWVGRTQLR